MAAALSERVTAASAAASRQVRAFAAGLQKRQPRLLTDDELGMEVRVAGRETKLLYRHRLPPQNAAKTHTCSYWSAQFDKLVASYHANCPEDGGRLAGGGGHMLQRIFAMTVRYESLSSVKSGVWTSSLSCELCAHVDQGSFLGPLPAWSCL